MDLTHNTTPPPKQILVPEVFKIGVRVLLVRKNAKTTMKNPSFVHAVLASVYVNQSSIIARGGVTSCRLPLYQRLHTMRHS
jgi:hypothetical protein